MFCLYACMKTTSWGVMANKDGRLIARARETQVLKVICYEVIEFSVSCDVISSLLPGLTPGLFYVPAALAKRSLGAPLSRAATTIPKR